MCAPVANINLSGLSDQEKEEYTKKAKASGATSRSEWLRWRLRAGVRLWDVNGNFDRETLDTALNDSEMSTCTTQSSTRESQPNLKEVIKSNLSTSEPTSFEDVQELVVEELVTTALYELQKEGCIENVPGKGYQRNWKND